MDLTELQTEAARLGYRLVPISETVKDTVRKVWAGWGTSPRLARVSGISLTAASERLRTAEAAGYLVKFKEPGPYPDTYYIAIEGLEWL